MTHRVRLTPTAAARFPDIGERTGTVILNGKRGWAHVQLDDNQGRPGYAHVWLPRVDLEDVSATEPETTP